MCVVCLGNSSETATVDENTREFFSELTDAGVYGVHVTTLSSSGDCEPRESSAERGFTFYLSKNCSSVSHTCVCSIIVCVCV